ncbi:MAG: tetraacyldisaccharide 4'-kinase [Nevskiales bacterium]|nr:tetraacyldisaccharide 4'-kinase [Nevskiales bacterium]
MSAWLQRLWYSGQTPPWALRLLARIYGDAARRSQVRRERRQRRLPVPVIVVGNISVGGTGKTPVTLWVLDALRRLGHRPGVLSRGYGGTGPFPMAVDGYGDPAAGGDEPVLIARRAGVPVVVAPDRHAAGQRLLALHPEVDVLVCDDGLQHRQLARDLELCVVDGVRGFGNGFLLPAGPLREPAARLDKVDLVLVNGGDATVYGPDAVGFRLAGETAVALDTGEVRHLTEFMGRTVHGVAGIGHPDRFFEALQAYGISVRPHPFADHHAYRSEDLTFGDKLPVLMTEKDAVKCARLGLAGLWMVPVDAVFEAAARDRLLQLLATRLGTAAS